MSKWLIVTVVSRLDVLVEVEAGELDPEARAQELALEEREFSGGGVDDIQECKQVTGEELESWRRHADHVVAIDD